MPFIQDAMSFVYHFIVCTFCTFSPHALVLLFAFGCVFFFATATSVPGYFMAKRINDRNFCALSHLLSALCTTLLGNYCIFPFVVQLLVARTNTQNADTMHSEQPYRDHFYLLAHKRKHKHVGFSMISNDLFIY